MKFRTDFVTNSSSSSYCSITVGLDSGKEIEWECNDSFYCDCETLVIETVGENKVFGTKSVDELISLLTYPTYDDGDEDVREILGEFHDDLRENIKDIKNIRFIECKTHSDYGGADWGPHLGYIKDKNGIGREVIVDDNDNVHEIEDVEYIETGTTSRYDFLTNEAKSESYFKLV